jgi:uncharacterized membrane protein HdeD (DUF308 family)
MLPSIFQPTGFAWKGILMTALGLIIILAPDVTIDIVMMVIGSIVLIAGIVLLLFEYRSQGKIPGFTYRVVEGLAYLVIGILFIANPRGSAGFLLILLAVLLLFAATIQFIGASRLPQGHPSKTLMMAGGLITAVFGILLFINPFGGAQALVTLLGILLLVLGITLLVLAGRVRKDPI